MGLICEVLVTVYFTLVNFDFTKVIKYNKSKSNGERNLSNKKTRKQPTLNMDDIKHFFRHYVSTVQKKKKKQQTQ